MRQQLFSVPPLQNPDVKNTFPASRNIAYTEWGDPQAMRILMCVHGLSRNSRDFDFLAEALTESDQNVPRGTFRIICPDIAGRGKSDWLGDASLYTYPLYVADCLALIDHLGITKLDWLGTSMGGIIGMMIAASRPALIQNLILNDVGPFIPAAALQRIADYLDTDTQNVPRGTLARKLISKMDTFNIPLGKCWDHVVEHSVVQTGNDAWSFAYDPAIARPLKTTEKIEDVDLWALWELVQAQNILILRGKNSDLLLPETVEQMKASKPNTESVEIPDVGHAPMLMTVEEIQLITNWLQKNRNPQRLVSAP